MPLFVSASKAARALLSRTNCERHLMRLTQRSNHNERHWPRSTHRSSHFERFVPVRFSSNFAGFKVSCVEDLSYNDKEGNHILRDMHKYVQARGFLGCGDGEEGSVLSKTYEEKLVLGYSPEQLYAVVAAVDMYEDFLPWCQRSKVVRHNPDGSFDAELEIGFKFFVESYISHVELTKNTIKTTASESNLFDHLINIWEFHPGPVPGSCNVYFLVDFKFQSPLYRQVASMFFKEVVSRLVESFSDRCRLIYGPGVPVTENSYGEQRR